MQWASTGTQTVQRVIGLMSGTSTDGVDAALVESQEDSLRPQIRVLAHATYPYEVALREQILAATYPESSSVDLICHVNVALGECFAAAAIGVAHTAGMPLDQIDLIGSHGQTIYHIPEASTTQPRCPSTLQIGEPCVIAERTGITTVADFRLRDGLAPCTVMTPDTYGYPNATLEAILFAMLAHTTVHGRPGNVPGATGARRAVVLGKIVPT